MTRTTAKLMLLSIPAQTIAMWCALDALHYAMSLLAPMLRNEFAREGLPVVAVGFTTVAFIVMLIWELISCTDRLSKEDR